MDLNRDPLHHVQTVRLESDDLAWIIGQQPDIAQSEVGQDLGPDSILSQIGFEPESRVRLHRIQTAVLQLIGAYLIGKPNASAFLSNIQKNALPLLGDQFERFIQLRSAVAPKRAEDIT